MPAAAATAATTTAAKGSHSKVKKQSNEAYNVVIAVCLFLVVLFSLPARVNAASPNTVLNCNNKGYVNATTGLCECISTYRGHSCEFKYCPYGRSWFAYPTEDHVRAQPRVECSNMGTCDPYSGVCACREGYEGRACERMSCPGGCSGRGQCVTMGEHALGFDGLRTVRPPVTYNGWDADSVMGCECDRGEA
jgi:hypothetical protein